MNFPCFLSVDFIENETRKYDAKTRLNLLILLLIYSFSTLTLQRYFQNQTPNKDKMGYENQVRRGVGILHRTEQDRRSVKSNPTNGTRLAVCIATMIAAFMLAACSDGSGTKSFRSSDEAISEYHGFLTTLRQSDKVPIQSLAKKHQRMACVGRFCEIVHST